METTPDATFEGSHEHSLDGWDIVHGDSTDWMPWGGDGSLARAKVLGTGDGYVAARGSTHSRFVVTSDATYVLAFKL